jgi:hypothetical protein
MLAGAAGVLGAAASRIRARRPDPDPPRAPGTRRKSRLPLGRHLRAKDGSPATSATAFPPPVAIPPRAVAPPPAAELLSLADGRTLAPPRPDGLTTSPGHEAVPLPASLLAPAPAPTPSLPVAPAAVPEITGTATFDVWSPARPALPGDTVPAPAPPTTEPPATTTAPAAPVTGQPVTGQPATAPPVTEPPGTEPAEPQPSFRRRAGLAAARQGRNLLALALYMGLSLGLFGHLILSHMNQRIMSAQPQDGVLFVWAFKWWPFAAAHHLPLFYTNFDWAPAGVNLTWATTIPGPSFLLNWLTTGHTAFFSFNMTELAAPALAAWTAYLLCRRITRAFFPSLIGGFFFGFSASLMDEIGQGHPSLTLMFLAPVAAYLIYRLLEGSIHPLLFMPLFAGVLYFQLTIGTEVFATMSVVGLLCALVLMAFGPNRRRIALLKAIPPVAGGYLLAMAACWPLLHAAFFGPRIDKAIHFNTIGYGAKNGSEFLRYLTPGRFSIFWGQFGHQWGDNPWYLGVPLILVILAFLITERRRQATWAVFAGFLVILVFSLGDQMPGFPGSIEPWGLLSSIPMLSIAQPGRLVTYAFLLVAVLVAMWLAQAKRPWLIPLRWLLVLAAAVMALPNFSVDVWTQVIPVPAFFTSNDYQKYIDRGQVVWVVSTHPSRQLTWQAGTDFYFRLAGGFFGGVPTGGPSPQPVDDWKEERLASGQVVRPDTTIDDIRFFLAEHHVSVIVAAEARWPIVHELQRALGAFGTKVDDVRVFRLGERFTNPALFDRPFPVLGVLIAQRNREQHEEWLRHHPQASQIAGAGPAAGAPPPPPGG